MWTQRRAKASNEDEFQNRELQNLALQPSSPKHLHYFGTTLQDPHAGSCLAVPGYGPTAFLCERLSKVLVSPLTSPIVLPFISPL